TSLHLENLSTFSPTLRASMNNTESSLNRMLDGRGKTRWSEKTGNQNGSEWIEISLPSETTALALDLNVGKFSSDFPRGVRVTSWPRVCDKRGEDKGEIVYEQAQWLGSVNFTPQGFPYYKPQNQVIIRFQSAVTTQCLLVEQTSSAPFDWSVTRLRIARLPTKST
ncbi:MAG: hypothetical protein KDD55_10945, partial [Bdellovibrionales bacterium]|nr:hypothetical protein [Bdellovibrionales bacterium]